MAHRLNATPSQIFYSCYVNHKFIATPEEMKKTILKKWDVVKIQIIIPQNKHHNAITWTYEEVIKED